MPHLDKQYLIPINFEDTLITLTFFRDNACLFISEKIPPSTSSVRKFYLAVEITVSEQKLCRFFHHYASKSHYFWFTKFAFIGNSLHGLQYWLSMMQEPAFKNANCNLCLNKKYSPIHAMTLWHSTVHLDFTWVHTLRMYLTRYYTQTY